MNVKGSITDGSVEMLSGFFREKTGLLFSLDMRRKLSQMVYKRSGDLDLSVIAYGRRVLRDSTEQQLLLEAVVNTETYFFREDYQLDLLRTHMLPALLAETHSKAPVVVWSTACSTGEEAYSVAIVAMEAGLQESNRLRIIGTDLLRKNVASAKSGRYTRKAFRATSSHRRRAFFVKRGGSHEVAPSVRAMCQFRQQNLLEMTEQSSGVRADVVLCRNALIYMTDEARFSALCNIYSRLRPGGYLLLGHAEMLLDNRLPFETVRHGQLVYYRRPVGEWTEHGRRRPCEDGLP